ncbi:TetR-like C-terminal domain-containing protein [Leucobacter sp. wl10]|uniref:TetR-like C-terminal domain-containing protein n=1 Tax=Leucobacter sp. wl10 TaxID=2304677 RepID=UPI000E5BBB9B|nr:TetR/AcrR family transcriptional regulator [Leucobacter sp. wl10]RGE18040.1 TetR/AcrR family transcriptional regulator [Leucobacter sp. wl10]
MPTPKGNGRPTDPKISEKLLDTAERILETDGFQGLRVEALVSEAQTSRPAMYRRFPDLAHLTLEVLLRRYGDNRVEPTGTLAGDLLQLQLNEAKMLSEPLMAKTLPALLKAVSDDPKLGKLLYEEFILPRRLRVKEVIDNAVDRGELGTGSYNLVFICNLLLGPLMSLSMVPSASADLSADAARMTAEVVERELRVATGSPE